MDCDEAYDSLATKCFVPYPQPHAADSPMRRSFGHHWVVHFLGIGLPLFAATMAYRSAVDPFVVGGAVLRIALVLVFSMLAIVIAVLYAWSGIQRYEIADDGLIIRRLWSRRIVAWQQIRRIDWNVSLHCVVLRESAGVITFTSTDLFPDKLEFLRTVHERSGCALSPHLEYLLNATDLPS